MRTETSLLVYGSDKSPWFSIQFDLTVEFDYEDLIKLFTEDRTRNSLLSTRFSVLFCATFGFERDSNKANVSL